MARLLKIILSIFTAIILLVIIAAVALPFFINPNDFKPEIQAAVKENIGRELTIDGDLELSVFPWIGISTGKLTLSNAQGFTDKPFAKIEESNIKVKLIPLLSKKLEVSRVVLKGLVLNLAKNKQGISNWDDLSSSENSKTQSDDKSDKPDKTEDKSTSPLAALAIGGVTIEQATIVWDDQQQGQYTEISDFNFKTGRLVFDEPIDVDLSLKVFNKEPELTELISFSTELVVNEKLDVFKLNEFNIKSVTRGKDVPGEELSVTLLAQIALDLTRQTMDISGLKLNTANLGLSADISGTNIMDKPVFKGPINIAEFNLAQLMKDMAMPLPEMQDSAALNKLSIAFDLLATRNAANFQNLVIKLDETNIHGSTRVKNFAKPEINFDLKVDTIDVDRYLSSEKEKEKEKSKEKSKENKSSKPVSTPASRVAASATLFPVETLRGLNAHGQLSIDKLIINKLKMQGLSFKLDAKNGLIKTEQAVKQLYQGTYTGKTTIDVKNRTPVLALNEKLAKVQIEPLLNDMLGEARMTGVVNVTARVRGRGNTASAIKSTLNGKVDFSLKNGVIRGFDLQQMIGNSKDLLKSAALLDTNSKSDQTAFSIIRGSAKINNGLVSNDDLYAEASKLRVNGKGTANLVSEKLDYKVKAKLLTKIATETEPEEVKGAIGIKIGGTFSNPLPTIDILDLAEILTGENKAKIEKKKDELLKKLDEKLGPGVGDLLKGLF